MYNSQSKPHVDWCNYYTNPSSRSSRVMTVKAPERKKSLGIRTANVSKATLAQQLAAMY